MSVIVFGANKVSFAVVKKLRYEGDIVVVSDDKNDPVELFDKLDVELVKCCPTKPKDLLDINASRARACIALTDNDEANIVSCGIMKEMFGTPIRIAKVSNSQYLPKSNYLTSQDSGGLSSMCRFVSLEDLAATSVMDNMDFVDGTDFKYFFNKDVALVGIHISQRVEAINKLASIGCSIVCIIRKSKLIGHNDIEWLEPDDIIYLVCKTSEMYEMLYILRGFYAYLGNKKVVIIGGGEKSRALISKIKEKELFSKIKVIEKDIRKATEISEMFKGVNVIHGDALDNNISNEINVGDADLQIAATDNDSVNIMTSFIAKKLGCKHCMSFINEHSYNSILSFLGVEMILNPLDSFVSEVLTSFKNSPFLKIHLFSNAKQTMVEALVLKNTKIVGTKISTLSDKYNIMVVAVNSKEKTIVSPMMGYVIKEGDQILLSFLYKNIKAVNKLLSVDF